jgi:two-component system response regulator FixJ
MESLATSHGKQVRGSVILVEDDTGLLEALKFGLELEGFEVQCHASPSAVLAETLPAADACLIIDYWLPGLDGLSLLLRLRTLGVGLPAIIITSHPTAAVLLRAATLGATVVEKPLLEDTLSTAIRNAIASQVGSAG